MRKTSHRFLALTFLLSLMPAFARGQDTKSPFSELDKRVSQERGRWAGNKADFTRIFDAERRRLGDKFESELMKYLGTDAEKHYWISAFLVAPEYLHGNQPLPHLALLIAEQGLSLLRGTSAKEAVGTVLGLSVHAAIVAETVRFQGLAEAHKQEAERLLSSDKIWAPGSQPLRRMSVVSTTLSERERAPARARRAMNIVLTRLR
jgi:hypothetical protein